MDTVAGSGCEYNLPLGKKQPLSEIEKAIITKYRKNIWNPFNKAVNEFNLIKDGDNIAVAISGGKDSLLLAKLMQELQKYGKISFGLKFFAMDPGFHEKNKTLLEENCKYLGIPLHISPREIFSTVDRVAREYPCYLCSRMRRGALYAIAEEQGCNKVALGHHFDDVIETILMNVLCSGKYQTMMPKLKSNNFENMELIRPMYKVKEEAIKKITSWNGLPVMNCGCIVAAKRTSSKRREVKELIKQLSKTFKDVDKCIYSSSKNVFQDAILGWVNGKERTDFQEEY